MIYARPGDPLEAILEGAATGLVGVLAFEIVDPPTGSAIVARTTAGIVETVPGAGVYARVQPAPAADGRYLVVWDTAPSAAERTSANTWTEQLEVNGAGVPIAPPSLDAPYFTIAELRAMEEKLASADRYPDDRLDDMRLTVEEALEHHEACNVAFVPRTRTDTVSACGPELVLPIARVRRVTSVLDDDGQAVDLAGARVTGKYTVRLAAGWPCGPLTVVYEHGYDRPPRRVKRAALMLAKDWLITGPITARATQVGDGAGGTINLATPGLLGSRFGIPEVDAAVVAYRESPPLLPS